MGFFGVYGETGLMTVCGLGALKGIKNLLRIGANPNAISPENTTPISYVLLGLLQRTLEDLNHDVIISLLLAAGAEADETSLRLAIQLQTDLEIHTPSLFESLANARVHDKKRSSSINISEAYRDTLIAYSVNCSAEEKLSMNFTSSPEAAKKQIESGVSFLNSEYDTVWNNLLLASLLEDIPTVQRILASPIPKNGPTDQMECSPLDLACFTGNIELVHILSAHDDEEINRCSKDQTPLILACQYGHLALVHDRLQIDSINHRSQVALPYSALETACAYGKEDIADVLMNAPLVDKDYQALHDAILADNVTLLNQLLASPIKWRADDRIYLLLDACKENKTTVAYDQVPRQSIEAINTEDADKYTPLDWASFHGNCALIQILIDHYARSSDSMRIAAKKGHLKALRVLDQHFNFDSIQLEQGLLIAAEFGQLEVVSYLVQKGVNVNCCDVLGKTPLHLAAGNLHLDVVKTLLQHRADIQKNSSTQGSPQWMAEKHGYNHTATLLTLVQTYGFTAVTDEDALVSRTRGSFWSNEASFTESTESESRNPCSIC